MNIEKAAATLLEELKNCKDRGKEQGHIDADDAIVVFLKSIGLADIAEEYDDLPKWYS